MQSITTPKITTTMYKICCRNPDITEVYVGQTKDITSRRFRHKSNCNTATNKEHHNLYVYRFIRENGGWNNWCVIPIELYVCENRIEAAARERYWVEILGATLNSQVPGRSKKEYAEDNSEAIRLWQTKHYEDNREVINQRSAKHYKDNREAVRRRCAKYDEENREAIRERKANYYAEKRQEKLKYYEDNREAINQRRRELRAAKKASSV